MIGLREIVIITMVVVALYGRSGVLKSKRAQTVLPWLSPIRRSPTGQRSTGRSAPAAEASARPRRATRIPGAFLLRGNRLYWFLTILAATAVAAWIVTRTVITSGVGFGLSH